MDDKFKKLINELSEILLQKSFLFIKDTLDIEKEVDTSQLINIIISSHISSLCNVIKFLSSQHPEMHEVTKKFSNELIQAISKIHPIAHIEEITINVEE